MATVQPAQAGRCGRAVMGGMSLKPSAVSKNIYFRKHNGSEVATDLELWSNGKHFFHLFNFPDFVGVLPELVKASHFSAILKAITVNYRMRLDLSREVLFLWDSAANAE